MDRMLYVAMTGARETMTAQAVLSNNLANISTAGFKADLSQFRSMPVFGPGEPTRVYAMSEAPQHRFQPRCDPHDGPRPGCGGQPRRLDCGAWV